MVRFKHRYILCQLDWADRTRINANLTQFEVLKCCKETVQLCFGEFGFAQIVTTLSGESFASKATRFSAR